MPTFDSIREFLGSIKVYDCGLTKTRIGNPADGGYVLYEELCKKSKVLYSFGIGRDCGFEDEWASRYKKCKFKLYDPTIVDLPSHNPRYTFIRYGVGLKYRAITGVVQDSTMKMDVEWEEWGAFQVFEDVELKKFSQMVVEFHLVHAEPRPGLTPYFRTFYVDVLSRVNQDLFAMYYATMKTLANYFYIFHIHANNSLPLVTIGGYTFPPLLEVSFVRKDLAVKPKISHETFPVSGLDLPNKSDRPDILDYYPFLSDAP